MGLYEFYDYYWNEMADPRVKGWMFMESIFPVSTILICYLYFVLIYGPRYMKSRPAYTLKNYTRVYNIFQVIVNYWMVKSLIEAGWFTKISVFCEPVDYSDDPMSVQLVHLMWYNLLVKLMDLSETVVFVLRKKDRQISFLHLYHHITTVIIQWLGARYVAGGMATFLALVNSSVHVIMYFYYFLSTFPMVQKAITPYKRIITIIQMIQFCILIVHIPQALMPSCVVPKIPAALGLLNIYINFGLFYHFYRKNYTKPKKT